MSEKMRNMEDKNKGIQNRSNSSFTILVTGIILKHRGLDNKSETRIEMTKKQGVPYKFTDIVTNQITEGFGNQERSLDFILSVTEVINGLQDGSKRYLFACLFVSFRIYLFLLESHVHPEEI